jgi:hypothetical protein
MQDTPCSLTHMLDRVQRRFRLSSKAEQTIRRLDKTNVL